MPTKPFFLSAAALFVTLPLSARAQTPPLPAAPPVQTAPAATTAQAAPLANPALKWEKTILGFAEKDKKTPPPTNPVLFTGSSSIVKWTTLAKDFPGVPVLNRGFGGSVISDSVFWADRTVVPYKPRKVLFYAGDNDIAGKKSPSTVLKDWQAFVGKVRAGVPNVPIVFISIKPSVSRWAMHEKQEEANRLIADWNKTQKNIETADVYHPMLGADGKPMPDLFVGDNLHMTPKGYEIWTRVLAPYVK